MIIIQSKILEYLSNPKRKRRNLFFIQKESWFFEIENAFKTLKIPNEWNFQRKIYHLLLGHVNVPICPISGLECMWRRGPATRREIDFPGLQYGYALFHSKREASSNEGKQLIKQNLEKSLLEKYGITNVFQRKDVKQKCKFTLIKRYGVDNISKLDSIKFKKAQTMMQKYKRPHNFDQNYLQQVLNEKYDVFYPAHIPSVAEICCNNRFKKKHEFTLPSGKVILLQGFEPKAFSLLLDEGFNEEEILFSKKDMPKIIYEYDNKIKRYYPDFFIPKINTIIEVKSQYTFKIDQKISFLKETATKNLGFLFRWIIF
jgi:hypothetical protein